MSFSVNDLLGVRFTFQETGGGNTAMNQLHYRIKTGELPETEEAGLAIIAAVKAAVAQPFLNNLSEGWHLRKATMNRLLPTKTYTYETVYELGPAEGQLAPSVGEDRNPRAAACLIRKSFKAGRRGMGRVFFGPLLGRFNDDGILVVDPVLGGDLNDVQSALTAEVTATVSSASVVLRPVIIGPKPTAVDAQHDVRFQKWSPYASYMRTRRPGRGM